MEQKDDLLKIPGMWDLPWVYAAGEIGSKYIAELRDNARLMATKCPECGRVLLPPRSFCERCFISLKGHWVELEPSGTLEAFTIVAVPFPGEREAPYIVGYFRIGEASTNIPHFLEGVDLSNIDKAKSKVWVGMPVKVVFREKRVGSMTDFYIEPL
jgi:uncharacterized OB-fold protein